MVAGIKKPILKSLLLYPASFYYYLMGSNLLLRLAWTYKLSPHLRHNHITVLMFALLEASAHHSPYCEMSVSLIASCALPYVSASLCNARHDHPQHQLLERGIRYWLLKQ